MAANVVKKSAAFYSYGETRLGQGRENAKEFLAQHPEIAQSIEARVRGDSPSLGQPSSNGSDPLQEDAAESVSSAASEAEELE